MFLNLLLSLAIVGVVALATIVLRRLKNRQVRQDALWFGYEQHMNELREASPEAEMARVAQVYQRAKSGTKAAIVWERTGAEQDSWFEGSNPSPGDLLLLRGSAGWGPDSASPNVFYVAPGQVLSSMTVGAQAAAARHRHRLAATGVTP
ncbi:hypothetical protein [Lentzea flaviverrucosa]|uniref:Uncharacterized protein n=1 Tax=Lentzea flaviverrucosa TaxID=200379 RepID=A0A1H9PYY7_9PSEU|nr:hypothetical protein [Lentzea flaviverrucosa]RDI29680.1 hypothetical protein DFR72_10598 [Lentzea flaviverrucosa]SER53404.1 hypothetical protein SAMN05216195_105475 [Lentzea flaviverrucosa]